MFLKKLELHLANKIGLKIFNNFYTLIPIHTIRAYTLWYRPRYQMHDTNFWSKKKNNNK